MAKIPVGATIAHAYHFAFGGFFNLLRLTWLPQAAVTVLLFAIVWPALASPLSGAAQLLLLVPVYLLMLVLTFVQMTAIAQAALGRTDAGWLHLPLGAPVWRLAGAWVLALLTFAAVFLTVAVVTGALGAVLGLLPLAGEAGLTLTSEVIAVAIFILDYAIFFFVGIRLVSLATPQVIADGRISVIRCWQLSEGNFWRLFAIALGTVLPFIAAKTAFFLLAAPPPRPQPGESGAQFLAAILDWATGVFGMMQTHWPLAAPLFALFSILFYGVFAAAQCFAWRAVTEEPSQVS